MTIQDEVVLALTIWRENRGGGLSGMQSVANVILNRAKLQKQSVYEVCTKHAQFSSISMPGSESYLWPAETDTAWISALGLAALAATTGLVDLTKGASSYYAPAGMPGGVAPSWAGSMTYITTIAGQRFYK